MSDPGIAPDPEKLSTTDLLAHAEACLRLFNIRTLDTVRTIPGPGETWIYLGSLDGILTKLPQALNQVQAALDHQKRNLKLRTDWRTEDTPEHITTQATRYLAEAVLHTETAAGNTTEALIRLRCAHSLTGYLGIDLDDDNGYDTCDDTPELP